MKVQTILFLINRHTNEICLAMKKRGFGVGKWNGTGGHVEPGESVEAAAVREAQEEIGVLVRTSDLVKMGEIRFYHPQWRSHCHIFFAYAWEGEPHESEEMSPRWWDLNALPFEQMWIDDRYWLPHILNGMPIEAEFHFSGKGDALAAYQIRGATV